MGNDNCIKRNKAPEPISFVLENTNGLSQVKWPFWHFEILLSIIKVDNQRHFDQLGTACSLWVWVAKKNLKIQIFLSQMQEMFEPWACLVLALRYKKSDFQGSFFSVFIAIIYVFVYFSRVPNVMTLIKLI